MEINVGGRILDTEDPGFISLGLPKEEYSLPSKEDVRKAFLKWLRDNDVKRFVKGRLSSQELKEDWKARLRTYGYAALPVQSIGVFKDFSDTLLGLIFFLGVSWEHYLRIRDRSFGKAAEHEFGVLDWMPEGEPIPRSFDIYDLMDLPSDAIDGTRLPGLPGQFIYTGLPYPDRGTPVIAYVEGDLNSLAADHDFRGLVR